MAHDKQRGERLRHLREEVASGQSQAAFARSVGATPQSYNSYEQGVEFPGSIAARLIDVTGCNLSWLFDGDGEMFTQPPIYKAGDHLERSGVMEKAGDAWGCLGLESAGSALAKRKRPWMLAAVRKVDNRTINIVSVGGVDGPLLPYRGPAVEAKIEGPGKGTL